MGRETVEFVIRACRLGHGTNGEDEYDRMGATFQPAICLSAWLHLICIKGLPK